MVRLIDRTGKATDAGMEAMRDMVRRRLTQAYLAEADAFDSRDTLDYLCRLSGGHARNLMMLMRYACQKAGSLPLTRAAAEQVARAWTSDFERSLSRPELFDVLGWIDKDKALPGTEHDQLLLYNLSVLEYLNGQPWYAVNPAIHALDKFKKARAAARRAATVRVSLFL